MTRWPLYLLCASLFLAGCNRAPQNKEAIREGVLEHVKKAGLELNNLNITVTDVKYEGNQATAQVSFTPKASPQAGMNLAYKLERRGDKWHVMGKGAGHGGMGGGAMGGGMGQPGGQMPPGHPPASPEGSTTTPPAGQMPPGHPPVTAPPPAK